MKTLEEKIKQAVSDKESPISQLAEKIAELIESNLEEALQSKSEYIRMKAEQLWRDG